MGKLDAIKAVLTSHVHLFAKRIAPVYAFLEWKWATGTGMDAVPDEEAIIETLHELISKLQDKPNQSRCGTGGLEVGYEVTDSGIEVFLRFEDELRVYPGQYLFA